MLTLEKSDSPSMHSVVFYLTFTLRLLIVKVRKVNQDFEMWHKGGLRFVNVYIDMCNYLHTESRMCTIVFIWFRLQISAHICTKVLISWDSVGGKNNPDQNILDRTGCFCRTTTNKHANQTWWLTGWCDGWRRTSSLNSKVLWMSTTCETSPGKVRKSHFAPSPTHKKSTKKWT